MTWKLQYFQTLAQFFLYPLSNKNKMIFFYFSPETSINSLTEIFSQLNVKKHDFVLLIPPRNPS